MMVANINCILSVVLRTYVAYLSLYITLIILAANNFLHFSSCVFCVCVYACVP